MSGKLGEAKRNKVKYFYRWISLNTFIKDNTWWSTLHIMLLCALWKQENFVELYIHASKQKGNTYCEYSIR